MLEQSEVSGKYVMVFCHMASRVLADWASRPKDA